MYHNGQGVDKNYTKAKEWYEKAVEQEHTMAQFNLGTMYDNGRGVYQSDKKAKEWQDMLWAKMDSDRSGEVDYKE